MVLMLNGQITGMLPLGSLSFFTFEKQRPGMMFPHGSTSPFLVIVYFNLQDNADSHCHLCPVCFDDIFIV